MINRKHLSQNIAFGLFRLLSLSVVGILFAILGFIIYKGVGVIDWEFLTSAPTDGMTSGGILPAIVGTFCLMAGSALFAFPVGVMSGIYMNEYAPKGWVVRFIRIMTNNLSGIPSIVFGLFGMALFVNYMDFVVAFGRQGRICDGVFDRVFDLERSSFGRNIEALFGEYDFRLCIRKGLFHFERRRRLDIRVRNFDDCFSLFRCFVFGYVEGDDP